MTENVLPDPPRTATFLERLENYIAEPDVLTAAIIRYVSLTAIPTLDKDIDEIETRSVSSDAFKARVRRFDDGSFEISAFDGIARTIATVTASELAWRENNRCVSNGTQ